MKSLGIITSLLLSIFLNQLYAFECAETLDKILFRPLLFKEQIQAASEHNHLVNQGEERFYLIPTNEERPSEHLYYFSHEELVQNKAHWSKNKKGEAILVRNDGQPFSTEYATDTFGGYSQSGIFVMDKNGDIYIELRAMFGTIHHSSLLSPVAGAGEIKIDRDGKILKVNCSSGHFTPSIFICKQVEKMILESGAKEVFFDYEFTRSWEELGGNEKVFFQKTLGIDPFKK